MSKSSVPARYQRNIGTLTVEEQRSLWEKKVIVVGLGGLGGYVLEELVRLGVGRIVGVDPDVFAETDLNRQLLADEENLGKKKVEVAGERLKRINSEVEFAGFTIRFQELEDEVWRDTDLVFDCLDSIDDRLALAERCSTAKVPLIHGAIAGWYGEVGVIWPGTQSLEKVYKSHGRGIEKDLGTPTFTPVVTASLMVAEGVKVLTGRAEDGQQQMLFFDLLENEWQRVDF